MIPGRVAGQGRPITEDYPREAICPHGIVCDYVYRTRYFHGHGDNGDDNNKETS